MKKQKNKYHKKSHKDDKEHYSKKRKRKTGKDYHNKKHKKQKSKYSSEDSSSSDKEHYTKSTRIHKSDFNKKIEKTDNIDLNYKLCKDNKYRGCSKEPIILDNSKDSNSSTYNEQNFINLENQTNVQQTKDYYSSTSEYNKNIDIFEPSSSKEHEDFKKYKKSKYTGDSKNQAHSDFTYLKFKHTLNKVFSSFNLVRDTEEFWIFVEKYELLEKKIPKPNKNVSHKVNLIGIPETYDIMHCINFSLNYHSRELFMKIQETKELTKERLYKFKEIIQIYMDFKQKEKFDKLMKLRTEQANLPVAQFKDEIIETVRNERVVIIAGDTGCGKSTQVPQYLYTAGFLKIACTQPRRIACISLAKRVAFETLTENKNEVGYQIRFEKQKNQDTRITFITEGLLLRQISGEGELSQYDVVVLDEIHERHLHGDFLLGIMKCLIHQRMDLKLVLMSATINIELFSRYFANENVKIIQVPGRLYPIQLVYRPILIEDKYSKSERFNPSPYIQIMQIIDKNYPNTESGDLLIFLSGMSEITAVVDAAKEYSKKDNNWIVLPLHSTLSLTDQDKIFGYAPEGIRKCIVSTNIAETSITIDGIRFVIDSGKVKEMSYDPTCKMQKLKEFWISKASAEQRKGRAGRTGPGVCYRLYSGEDYSAFETYSKPELQKVPLDSSILQMISMGLPDSRKFPFIEPPPTESIENSILCLKEQGALTENEKLTTIGKTLARLPVDITIGKMLIMGSVFHQIEPILSLAAALTVQSPFTNKAYRDLDCETSRKNLESDHGDPITLLNAYKEWLEIKHTNSNEVRSGSATSKKWCRRRGLEEQRFYEITKLRTQFKDLLEDCNLLHSSEFNSEMTSSERTIRHGEMKLLRSLKRSYKQNDSQKRKLLKPDNDDIQIEDNKEDEEIDIKDVEFRMKNDFSQVSNLVTASTACSYKDLMMLKLILCSGLYPQFAIPDEFNYCKTINEQLFHTKVKPFVALHPMSFFGNHPQVLQLEESEIIPIPGYKSKTPISSKHQILTYLSLLETTKPYLVNTLRVPAAQTLLLFCQEMDTNSTFTTIVCDSWLSLDFPIPDNGAFLLYQAVKLREKWDKLLNLQLSSFLENKTEDIRNIEYELSKELVDFMHTSVPYTIKRLLTADLKNIYVGPETNFTTLQVNPFSIDFECEPHERKGGLRVTKQITFNCLLESDWSDKVACEMLEIEWACQICDFKGNLSSMEKLQHMSICKTTNDSQEKIKSSLPEFKKKNAIAYECSECQKTLYLTPTEVLRHKKKHEA